MANDELLELFKQHSDFQNKYAYFMIAVAGSAIAFAIQKSEGAVIEWPLAPLALAILCFGLSFYCGIRRLEWTGATLGANYAMVQLRRGTHPKQPPPGQLAQAATQGVFEAMEENSDKANRHAVWQMRWLFCGVVLFVIWHAVSLYLMTYR